MRRSRCKNHLIQCTSVPPKLQRTPLQVTLSILRPQLLRHSHGRTQLRVECSLPLVSLRRVHPLGRSRGVLVPTQLKKALILRKTLHILRKNGCTV